MQIDSSSIRDWMQAAEAWLLYTMIVWEKCSPSSQESYKSRHASLLADEGK